MTETYISVDIETDGPIPGPHSMLSFGAAAFGTDRALLDTFTANLELLVGAMPDPKTAAWWTEQSTAYAKTRENCVAPSAAMPRFVSWVEGLGKRPVFVAYPAGFDFTFMYWYMIKFAGRSPFSHSALDMKTFAMAKLGTEYRNSTKRNMPKAWFSDRPHTHVALDDAIEQGELFMNMLAAKPAEART